MLIFFLHVCFQSCFWYQQLAVAHDSVSPAGWLGQVNRLRRKLGTAIQILLLGLLVTNLTSWTPELPAVSLVKGQLRSVHPDARLFCFPSLQFLFRFYWLFC